MKDGYHGFLFTYFTSETSETSEVLEMIRLMDAIPVKYIFQREECPTTGKRHLQGYLEFPNRRAFTWQAKFPKEIHWTGATGGTRKNIIYCSKDRSWRADTERVVKGWSKSYVKKCQEEDEEKEEVEDYMDDLEFHAWQAALKVILLGPRHRRAVHWMFDEAGGKGKTAFIRHMCLKHKAIIVGGKAGDIKFQIMQMKVKPKIVFWNVVRTQESFVSFAAIEEVKDAIFFSPKYESGMCIFNPPHVVVMANFAPDLPALSRDRWIDNVWELLDDGDYDIVDCELRKEDEDAAPLTGFRLAAQMFDDDGEI